MVKMAGIFSTSLICNTLLNSFLISSVAYAQTTATPAATVSTDTGSLQEIVVTAEKRSESINKVGASVIAVSGQELTDTGVVDASDLQKVVPGFTFSESNRGTPVYAIRGIGFDESTLGADSTVALYTDEVPIPFAPEARFAALDLQQVEVLKGPQGTLYGQNSTGGAINFIAAKPTDTLAGGFDASYGRFNTINASGFISGPLTDTLKARLAVLVVDAGDWQQSYTRDASLGAKHQFATRFLLDWNPSDELKIELNVNGWIDRSDTLAGQFIGLRPTIPAGLYPALANYPVAPSNDRAADWDAGQALRRHDNFFQTSLRAVDRVTDHLTVTSISAYSYYNQNFRQDDDGTDIQNALLHQFGSAKSYSQEIRLGGDYGPVKFIVGGDYSDDRTNDDNEFSTNGSTSNVALGGLIDSLYAYTDQNAKSAAAFGNVDWTPIDPLTLHAGVRYTNDMRSNVSCTTDSGNGHISTFVNDIVTEVTGVNPKLPPGACIVLNQNFVSEPVSGKLNQDNVGFNVGADWTVEPGLLLYANVSRGFKAGSFPNINATSYIQYQPVTQESVLAYETGFKASFFDRSVQWNSALFYYDYSDKQLRGRILDPLGVFGALDALVNVPHSRIEGAETSVTWAPTRGLTVSVDGTYLDSKVTGTYENYDPFGEKINFGGLPFPHTPKWNVVAAADYSHPLNDKLKGFTGANLDYQSKTSSFFNRPAVTAAESGNANIFEINAYATVDVRLGVGSQDDHWRAWVWGKNIFDKYYWTNVTTGTDTIYRLPAMPATFGVAVSLRF